MPKQASTKEKQLSISSEVLPGVMGLLDSFAILSVAFVSYVFLIGRSATDMDLYAAAVAFVWLVAVMLMNFAGLYRFEPIMRPITFADKIIISFVTTFMFLLAAAFSLRISTDYSRIWVGTFAVGACTMTIVLRVAASYLLEKLADNRVFARNVLIVGTGEQMRRLLSHLSSAKPRFVKVLGLITHCPNDMGGLPWPVLGGLDDLVPYIRRNNVDDVIISLPWSADEEIALLVGKLRELPVNVYLGSDLVGYRLPFQPPPDHFGRMPLVEIAGRPLAGWSGAQKTALDYGLGFLLVLCLAPLMAVIALAIKIEGGGSVFFRQERFGFVNRVFRIYKFRTMKFSSACENQTVQASRNDPRITRVGRVLRRFSLDELPQLFNVLNGTMSLVGPRPHAVDHNEMYSQVIRGYFARHRVKPGLTGWAQVNGFRGETKTLEAMEARVKYDIDYVENWSLLHDFKILAMTIFICLTGRNAY